MFYGFWQNDENWVALGRGFGGFDTKKPKKTSKTPTPKTPLKHGLINTEKHEKTVIFMTF